MRFKSFEQSVIGSELSWTIKSKCSNFSVMTVLIQCRQHISQLLSNVPQLIGAGMANWMGPLASMELSNSSASSKTSSEMHPAAHVCCRAILGAGLK